MLGYKKSYKRARELRRRQTKAEVLLWKELRNRKLGDYKFCRQVPIGPFITDFCCREYKLIIEVDGGIHKYQKHYDYEREQILKTTGYKILRFTNDEVYRSMDSVLMRILQDLQQQSCLPIDRETEGEGISGTGVCNDSKN